MKWLSKILNKPMSDRQEVFFNIFLGILFVIIIVPILGSISPAFGEILYNLFGLILVILLILVIFVPIFSHKD